LKEFLKLLMSNKTKDLPLAFHRFKVTAKKPQNAIIPSAGDAFEASFASIDAGVFLICFMHRFIRLIKNICRSRKEFFSFPLLFFRKYRILTTVI